MPETDPTITLPAEQQKELEKKLLSVSKEGRINCTGAFAIAKSFGIPPAEVGKVANKLNIKISKCQLGCF
jgi:hypothetical protein